MTYINYVRHPRYGQVWYTARLSNWWCMGLTAEENRRRGPLVELRADKFLLCGAGTTVADAEDQLLRILSDYWADERTLPTWTKKDELHHLFVVCLPWRLRHPLKFLRTWRMLHSSLGRVRLPS